MLVKSAVTAALAATAHSFVVIPDVAPADSAFAEVAPLNPSENRRSVSVDCPRCPVAVPAFDGGEPTVATDVPNHLEMTFSIDAAPEGDRLLANGFELYPNPDPFSSSLSAAQILELTDMAIRAGMKAPANERSLGSRLQVYPLAKDQDSQFIEVIGVDLQIIEVGETFVDGVPLVKVLLGKKGDDLAIMDVKTFDSTASVDPAAECTTFICKVRAFIAKKLATLRRPCPGKIANKFHGHHGHHGIPHHGPGGIAKPQGGPPHGHHHHKHPRPHFSHPHRGGAFKAIAMIVFNVLFPILLGIFVGVSVGL